MIASLIEKTSVNKRKQCLQSVLRLTMLTALISGKLLVFSDVYAINEVYSKRYVLNVIFLL